MGESSNSSGEAEPTVMSGTLPREYERQGLDPYRLEGITAGTFTAGTERASYFGQSPSPETVRRSVESERQESFLGDPQPVQREGFDGQGMAPIAAGAAGAGVGFAAVDAHPPMRGKDELPVAQERTPDVPPKSELRSATPPPPTNDVAFGANTTATSSYIAPSSPIESYAPASNTAATSSNVVPGRSIEPDVLASNTAATSSNIVPGRPLGPAAFASNTAATSSNIVPKTSIGPDVLASNTAATSPNIVPWRSLESAALASNTVSTTQPALGGLESEGARETGAIIPLIRHGTNMSISQLHVPGEFPKQQI